jgi:hypothetical protein
MVNANTSTYKLFFRREESFITQKVHYIPEQIVAQHKLELEIATLPNADFVLLAVQAHGPRHSSLFSYG